MVSQPSHSTDLAIRGPSSVVSSSSRHRSSRSARNRSHAGGISYTPQNEFPVFTHTGDVEILVKAGSQTNRYLLHRLILTQCSGFFEASTSEEWSKATIEGGELARIGEDSGSDSARGGGSGNGGRKRWRYELDNGTGEGDIPMLVQRERTEASLFGQPPPVRSKPPASSPSFFRSVANLSLTSSHAPPLPALSQADQDLLNDYDNLFRIFYNYAPALDAIDIATAYLQCKSLLRLADLYDALPVVGPRIDHHLLQFNSRLYKQIAKYPASYLKIGYLAQSKTIYQEALIHVVGAWPVGERHIRHQLPDAVLDVIEDKVDELAELVGQVEGRLFRLSLLTSRGERVTPHNSYLDWLAISLFRQWVAENTSPPAAPPPPRSPPSRNGDQGARNPNSLRHHTRTISSSQAPPPPAADTLSLTRYPIPGLGRIYRLIGATPSAYLLHDECKRFLKLSPEIYSRESLRKFEKRLEEIKGLARTYVQPLMRDDLLGGDGGISYLTCTRVEERDFVWLEH